MASPETGELLELLFSRYPRAEWATFLRLGWRETSEGWIFTLCSVDRPQEGDLDPNVGHVAIQESYTLRTALAAETHEFAVGLVHSHPKNCRPQPSDIDDDMDGYYAPYFDGFTRGRPYVSLIASELDGRLTMSGRVFCQGTWHAVTHFTCDGRTIERWTSPRSCMPRASVPDRLERLSQAFGESATHALCQSSVAVIGAGGTGSAAIELLARAGVGHLIVVDPDRIEASNLERLHGGLPRDASDAEYKVRVAKRHIHSIDPQIEVTACIGAIPQRQVVDAVLSADLVLGCTDQQHSRLALSELAYRYLLPAIDCAVAMEGAKGKISGQTIQQTWFLPTSPCALCRNMVNPQRLGQELMSDEERTLRAAAAADAQARGEDPNPYWVGVPQLNTVGYLTTAAASIAVGYAIGLLADRFQSHHNRMQLNLFARFPEAIAWDDPPRAECSCRRRKGWADQGHADALITAPSHWPAPLIERH